MFLPKGIQLIVVCDFDDPNERLVSISVCNGGAVTSLTSQKTLSGWAELGRKIESYDPTEEKTLLLRNNWNVEPPDGEKYNREERLILVREYANKIVLQLDVTKKFPGGGIHHDGTGLAMRPELVKELGMRIAAWSAAGAVAPLACYLIDGAWKDGY